jgi:hypothetical protein
LHLVVYSSWRLSATETILVRGSLVLTTWPSMAESAWMSWMSRLDSNWMLSRSS